MRWTVGLTWNGVARSAVLWGRFLPVNVATIQSFTEKEIGPASRGGRQLGRWFGVALGILLVDAGRSGCAS